MSTRTEMLSLLQSRKSQFSLPGRFYSDPAFYDLDLDVVFHRRWLFARFECEVERPGQFFTLTVGRHPNIVRRHRGGPLRAFFNPCPLPRVTIGGWKRCQSARPASPSIH